MLWLPVEQRVLGTSPPEAQRPIMVPSRLAACFASQLTDQLLTESRKEENLAESLTNFVENKNKIIGMDSNPGHTFQLQVR